MLPQLAELFQVSIDELIGYVPKDTSKDLVLEIKQQINSIHSDADAKTVCDLAFALHAIYFSKRFTDTHPTWDYDAVIKNIGKKEWGYSAFAEPSISTVMCASQVFFSDNTNLLWPNEHKLRILSKLLKLMSNYSCLNLLVQLYRLTYQVEGSYTSCEELMKATNLNEEQIKDYLNDELLEYIESTTVEEVPAYRIYGSRLVVVNVLLFLADLCINCE